MTQLKQSVVAEVRGRLNGKRFTEYDFDLEFPSSGNTLVQITLKVNSKYCFAVSEELDLMTSIAAVASVAAGSGQRSKMPTTTECPGDVKVIEKRFHRSLDDAFDRVSPWLENVYADLKAKTIGLKELEELRQQLEAHIASHDFDAEEFFQDAELDRLNERLDALMNSFEELESQHRITAEQLDQLRGDVEQMKQAARDMPKGVWATMAKSRMVMAARRVVGSPEGRQFMLEAAKKLLLGDSTKA